MAILYFWVRDIYLDNTADKPNEAALEQNGVWLGNADQRGESLWAFTRNSRGEYALVLKYRIKTIRHVGDAGEYGEYRVIPEPGTSIWFDPEKGPPVEGVIRKLSIAPTAPVLGSSFQGRGAIRRITRADDRLLLAFSKKMTGRPKPRASDEAKLRHGAALIQWQDADDWIDFIPLHFFVKGPPRLASHALRRGKETSIAHCLVTVSDNEIQLDYSHHSVAQLNEALQNDIGIARLRFTSSARDDIPDVDWYDKKSQRWTLQNANFSWPTIARLDDYVLPVGGKAKRRQRPVKERPGQKTFRSKLSRAYGEICMLSRCAVEEALDAAHIDPFEGPEFDHPQNGLLLRKDLHCLFDNDLLGFEPTSGRAYFGTAAGQVAYPDLHGKRCLVGPHALFASYRPSRDALERRWKIFCKRHGAPSSP